MTAVGQETTFNVPSEVGFELTVLLQGDRPQATGRLTGRQAIAQTLELDIAVECHGSPVFLAVTCAMSVVGSLVVVAICWVAYHHSQRSVNCIANPRLHLLWVRILMSVSLVLLLLGAAWMIIVAVSSEPMSPAALYYAAAAMVGVGATLLLVTVAWALRDPEPQNCFGCGEEVSQWRFIGTYVAGETPGSWSKAHTAHTLCILCRKPVTFNPWHDAPAHRPHHLSCWQDHCCTVVESVEYVRTWCTEKRHELTETELVHVLCAAVQHSAVDVVQELLAVNPMLTTRAVAKEGGRSVMHVAVRAGNMAVFHELLRVQPAFAELASPMKKDVTSLLIQGTANRDDVYILQPTLEFNDHLQSQFCAMPKMYTSL